MLPACLPPWAQTKPSRRHPALAMLFLPQCSCLAHILANRSIPRQRGSLISFQLLIKLFPGLVSLAMLQPRQSHTHSALAFHCSFHASPPLGCARLSDRCDALMTCQFLAFQLPPSFLFDIPTSPGNSICRCQRSWLPFFFSLILTLSWTREVLCPGTLKIEPHWWGPSLMYPRGSQVGSSYISKESSPVRTLLHSWGAGRRWA